MFNYSIKINKTDMMALKLTSHPNFSPPNSYIQILIFYFINPINYIRGNGINLVILEEFTSGRKQAAIKISVVNCYYYYNNNATLLSH